MRYVCHEMPIGSYRNLTYKRHTQEYHIMYKNLYKYILFPRCLLVSSSGIAPVVIDGSSPPSYPVIRHVHFQSTTTFRFLSETPIHIVSSLPFILLPGGFMDFVCTFHRRLVPATTTVCHCVWYIRHSEYYSLFILSQFSCHPTHPYQHLHFVCLQHILLILGCIPRLHTIDHWCLTALPLHIAFSNCSLLIHAIGLLFRYIILPCTSPVTC